MTTRQVRWLPALSQLPAGSWDGLHDGRNPFLAHAFLAGLEQHGCLRPEWGWTPMHATVWDGETLAAAAPGYLKTNSHGEFVFDHAWADAYARHGRPYYPKWLCAVPYSPVSGPRLLARDEAARRALLQAIAGLVERGGLSSAHINFLEPAEDASLPEGWLGRTDLQYHWRNPGHWRDFDGFLADMDHKHRKNIRQERAKVARSGVGLRVVHGDQAGERELRAMYRFYRQTFDEYGNSAALTLPFLRHLAAAMPRQLVMFLAEDAGEPVAGALCLRGGDALYGRYWGGQARPGLHFEACYYQGIEYCLREGLHRFEPGAQGQHKIARGFMPSPVYSRHWIADPGFRAPLADWCDQERRAVAQHAVALAAHGPFRAQEAS